MTFTSKYTPGKTYKTARNAKRGVARAIRKAKADIIRQYKAEQKVIRIEKAKLDMIRDAMPPEERKALSEELKKIEATADVSK